MLVVVNPLHTNEVFKVEGTIPENVIEYLNKSFGENNVIVEDDEYVDFRETDWYKEISKTMTPGSNIKDCRKERGMKQVELAALLGVPKQFVSNMEHDLRPVSKEMAKKLAKIFKVSVARFIC